MPRPYFTHSTKELEEEFEKHRADLVIVRSLRDELNHRAKRRALRLRAAIDTYLSAAGAPITVRASISAPQPVIPSNHYSHQPPPRDVAQSKHEVQERSQGHPTALPMQSQRAAAETTQTPKAAPSFALHHPQLVDALPADRSSASWDWRLALIIVIVALAAFLQTLGGGARTDKQSPPISGNSSSPGKSSTGLNKSNDAQANKTPPIASASFLPRQHVAVAQEPTTQGIAGDGISDLEKNEPRLDMNATEWIADRSRSIAEIAKSLPAVHGAVFMGNWHSDGWIVFYESFFAKYPHLSDAFEDYAALHQTWLMRHAKERSLWKEEYGHRDYRPPLDMRSLSTTLRKQARNKVACIIILAVPQEMLAKTENRISSPEIALGYETRVPRPTLKGYYEPMSIMYPMARHFYVSEYTRRDGTRVQSHFRSLSRK